MVERSVDEAPTGAGRADWRNSAVQPLESNPEIGHPPCTNRTLCTYCTKHREGVGKLPPPMNWAGDPVRAKAAQGGAFRERTGDTVPGRGHRETCVRVHRREEPPSADMAPLDSSPERESGLPPAGRTPSLTPGTAHGSTPRLRGGEW
jgi:hypothetical protein